MSMCEPVQTTLAFPQNGLALRSNGVGLKLASQMMPLSSLLNNNNNNNNNNNSFSTQPDLETPILSYGDAMQVKKNEDFAFVKTNCLRIPGDESSTYSAFAIFDGHNGDAAAVYSKENLLKDVMSVIPSGLSRDEWLAALPRAMVAGFVKTDSDWQQLGQTSGTTATLVIVDGWTVTVACVGDSRCILDAQGTVTALTIDHRLDSNEEERERIKACGAQVAKLTLTGGIEVGPLRVWPGGLCLSRSIGDMDVGEYIVPVPHVKQIKLSPAGGRLILASDGVWDSVTTSKAARCCRGVQQPEVAAKYVVKIDVDTSKSIVRAIPAAIVTCMTGSFQEALRIRGLRDDTTCLIVDIAPPGSRTFAPALKKPSSFRKLLRCTQPQEIHITEDYVIEELFEETSAALPERLGPEASVHAGHGLFHCSICHCNLEADAGISVHAGSFFSQSAKLWEGPFLCVSCKIKQGAMEGNQQEPNDQSS